MVIRAYHQSRGQGYRNIVPIPSSAHGTNPASAAMAGMKIVTVGCDANGNIDVEDPKAKAQEHSSELACMMITYPSTHGVFESRIREIVDAVHDAGGQVYMDGANMNAQVGLTNPGYIGADVCHPNLHKTFAMPHGGGGPGVGPICVAEHLRKFLPSHSIVPTGGDEGITAVASAPWGSAMLFPITYGYIKMLGGEGLKAATEMAIVNANYMSSALKSEYRTYYSGETGRVGHEMILDLTHFKKDYNIDCGDIAHRLMDYGFHAPTLSFPVHETPMVEPTESEPKAEMDRFIATLIQIKRECEEAAASGEADNVVVNAPPHGCRNLRRMVASLHARKGSVPARLHPRVEILPPTYRRSTTATATAIWSAAARNKPGLCMKKEGRGLRPSFLFHPEGFEPKNSTRHAGRYLPDRSKCRGAVCCLHLESEVDVQCQDTPQTEFHTDGRRSINTAVLVDAVTDIHFQIGEIRRSRK